jgi:hypothetical protein
MAEDQKILRIQKNLFCSENIFDRINRIDRIGASRKRTNFILLWLCQEIL